MELILDTNAVAALSKGDPAILNALRSSRTHSLPVIVLGEFEFGLQRSVRKEVLSAWLKRLETNLDVLGIDRKTAQCYATIREELRSAGTPIPENDIWIAALSRQHGLAVLTRDTQFNYVNGLVRYGW